MLAAEISEALSRGVATDAIDEGELDEELEAMQQESLDQKMLGAEAAPIQPVHAPGKSSSSGLIPSSIITTMRDLLTFCDFTAVKAPPKKTADEEEEEELRRLQAEFAI
jgi:charged multivesicular body protein 4A/B